MSIRSAGMLGCVALMGTVLAAASFTWEAADQAVCDAKERVANLNFTLKDMNGKDVALSAYKGQVILLDFWATWCGPCKIEIPGFVDLYTRYRQQGFFGPLLGYPTSFVISRNGKVCTRHTGLTSKEQIEREIKTLM
jgi:glutathione peroxidase-family protein